MPVYENAKIFSEGEMIWTDNLNFIRTQYISLQRYFTHVYYAITTLHMKRGPRVLSPSAQGWDSLCLIKLLLKDLSVGEVLI